MGLQISGDFPSGDFQRTPYILLRYNNLPCGTEC